jgi:ubiquitin carboxyl-terminal hydrolase 7
MGINIRIQEDAHEFLLLLLSSIDESDNHGIKRSIRNRFTGVMESYIQCKNINYSSTRMEPFMDLSLDLDSNQSNTKKDLITMLEAYFKPIELINENKYQTPDNGKQDAIKGYKIVEYPDILIVHINRFAYDITTQMAHKVRKMQYFINLIIISYFILILYIILSRTSLAESLRPIS